MAGPAFPGHSPTREVPHGHRVHVHRYRCDRAGVTEPERLALAGFLAGDAGLAREACALDLRQYASWCAQHQLRLFQARRADIECFARDLEARGRARATITRRLCTIAGFCNYAVEEELLDHSPAAHVRRPRLDYESHVTGLDRDELGALLVAAGSASPPSTRSSRCWPQRAACLRSHRRQHRVPGRRTRAPDIGGHPQGRQDSSHAAKPTSCHHRWASLGEPSNYAAAKGHR